MIGDQNDFAARLKAVLPAGWFADTPPVLNAVLAGFGAVWASVYALYAWVVPQTRMATASDAMLDLTALDFYGSALVRRAGEADASLRSRIGEEMFRERATRAAVVGVLSDLVGVAPLVFEPARPGDTGAYNVGGVGYGVAGGYGSLLLPMQCFVIAFRGSRSVIANVMGYGTPGVAGHWAGGGYGAGAIEYASLAWTEGQVTDADMEAAVAAVMPINAIAWMAIVFKSPWTAAPGAVTGLVAA